MKIYTRNSYDLQIGFEIPSEKWTTQGTSPIRKFVNTYCIKESGVLRDPWDGVSKTLFKTPDLSNYQPWRNVARGKRTCTADMCVAQDVQQENQSAAIDKKDIKQVLHSRNLLRLAEKTQISPNRRYCSVKFNTAQTMQTFCTEGLTISENSNIFFKPD